MPRPTGFQKPGTISLKTAETGRSALAPVVGKTFERRVYAGGILASLEREVHREIVGLDLLLSAVPGRREPRSRTHGNLSERAVSKQLSKYRRCDSDPHRVSDPTLIVPKLHVAGFVGEDAEHLLGTCEQVHQSPGHGDGFSRGDPRVRRLLFLYGKRQNAHLRDPTDVLPRGFHLGFGDGCFGCERREKDDDKKAENEHRPLPKAREEVFAHRQAPPIFPKISISIFS